MKKLLCPVRVAANSLVIGVTEHGTRILFDTGGRGMQAVGAEGDADRRPFELAERTFETKGVFPGWHRGNFLNYVDQTKQGDSIDIVLGTGFLSQYFSSVVFSTDGLDSLDNFEEEEKSEGWIEMVVVQSFDFPVLSTNFGPFFLDTGMAKSFNFNGIVNEPRDLEGPKAFFYSPQLGVIEACTGDLGLTLNQLNGGEPLKMSSLSSAKKLRPQNGFPEGIKDSLLNLGFSGFIGADLFEKFDLAVLFHERKVFLRPKHVV